MAQPSRWRSQPGPRTLQARRANVDRPRRIDPPLDGTPWQLSRQVTGAALGLRGLGVRHAGANLCPNPATGEAPVTGRFRSRTGVSASRHLVYRPSGSSMSRPSVIAMTLVT